MWVESVEDIKRQSLIFPGGAGVKNLSVMQRHKKGEFDPWVRKIPWRRKWQPTPVFFPGETHGQKNLSGYSIHGFSKESVTTKGT